MSIKSVDDLLAQGVSGRGVLVRSDLNVPLDDAGTITDSGRITASVPTLKALHPGHCGSSRCALPAGAVHTTRTRRRFATGTLFIQ
ncbi:phosphoglycerate kinase, partial [Mycolicibacterium vaccae]|nr:phosphoglycerate kinase [Mycolicibacterium vaccae]